LANEKGRRSYPAALIFSSNFFVQSRSSTRLSSRADEPCCRITTFHVLPSISPVPPGSHPWDYPDELVLPVATLVIAVSPYVSRIMRASMIEVLESDYVEMARLKGLSERRVLWRHAVPNALAPTFQVAALNLAYLAGGIVVVEAVFNYPGIGLLLVESVRARDMPTVQAIALFIAALYVVLNLLADVATILVSPRLRTSLQ